MRFARYRTGNGEGIAVADAGDDTWAALNEKDPGYLGSIETLIAAGGDWTAVAQAITRWVGRMDIAEAPLLPPLANPSKIICIGLNYSDHARETGMVVPDYPTVFARFSSSVIGHGSPIIRPRASNQLDFEGELAAVIGRARARYRT